MSDTRTYSSDVAFTPAVKAVQAVKGSREIYEERGDWHTEVDENLAAFLADTNSFYLATASGTGQPYIQHRGGPKGFIKVLDKNTIAFADYRGNRQYITLANLTDNDRAFLFLLNPATQQRIKLWGHARVVENDPDLIARLFDAGYQARPERVVLFTIDAWDVNCSQHIAPRFTPEEIAQAARELRARIAALEAENRELREVLGRKSATG